MAEARNRAAARGSGGESTDAEEVDESEDVDKYSVIAIGTLPMDDFEAYKAGEAEFVYVLCTGLLTIRDDGAYIELIRNGESENRHFSYSGVENDSLKYIGFTPADPWVLYVPNEFTGAARVVDYRNEVLYDIRIESADDIVEGSEPFVGLWKHQNGTSTEITSGGLILNAEADGVLASAGTYTIDEEVLRPDNSSASFTIENDQLAMTMEGYEETIYFDRVE